LLFCWLSLSAFTWMCHDERYYEMSLGEKEQSVKR
jgi:hypothetical protein